jgi:hypothetical protein
MCCDNVINHEINDFFYIFIPCSNIMPCPCYNKEIKVLQNLWYEQGYKFGIWFNGHESNNKYPRVVNQNLCYYCCIFSCYRLWINFVSLLINSCCKTCNLHQGSFNTSEGKWNKSRTFFDPFRSLKFLPTVVVQICAPNALKVTTELISWAMVCNPLMDATWFYPGSSI